MESIGGGGTGLLARLRPALERAGFEVEAIDYREIGFAGDGDACHAVIADWAGRTVADAWGPTPDAALVAAMRDMRTLDD